MSRFRISIVLCLLISSNLLVVSKSNAALFAFTTHTFTTCGTTGQSGPTQAACRSSYSTAWDDSDSNFIVTSGVQKWTVPATGSYQITAIGASGAAGRGSTGGRGASITGTFSLTEGQIISIIVGQKGTFVAHVAGGGGGSFVYQNASDTYPMLAAGGGGGGGAYDISAGAQNGVDASTTTSGTNGNAMPNGGGTSGNGGQNSTKTPYALGGAGWLSNGNLSDRTCTNYGVAAQAPRNGGLGGNSNQAGTFGGFGGGGAPAMRCGAIGGGGGGGYSGGGPGGENIASNYGGGGGGGSYNGGTSQVINGVTNTGEGSIVITELAATVANFNSYALAGGVTVANYRTSITINASVDISSKVTFRAGSTVISGCKNKVAAGSGSTFNASCLWKPSSRGKVVLSATATPISGGDIGRAAPVTVTVLKRTGAR